MHNMNLVLWELNYLNTFPVKISRKKYQKFFWSQNVVLKRNGWYTSSYWHWRYFFSWSLDKLHDRNMFNRVMGNSVRFSKTFSSSLNFLIWYLWSYNCANRSSKILTRLQLRCMNFSVFVCFNRNNKVPAQFSQTFSCVFQEISKLTITFQSFTPTSTGKKNKAFHQLRKHRRKCSLDIWSSVSSFFQ